VPSSVALKEPGDDTKGKWGGADGLFVLLWLREILKSKKKKGRRIRRRKKKEVKGGKNLKRGGGGRGGVEKGSKMPAGG